MMTKLIQAILFCLLTLAAYPALADTVSDLTDAYTADGAPLQQESTFTGFHGLLGAGLLSYQKNIGDSSRKGALLPLVALTYQDWAHWSIGGGGIWVLQADDHSAKLGVGIKYIREGQEIGVG